jgi:hypothetical protein
MLNLDTYINKTNQIIINNKYLQHKLLGGSENYKIKYLKYKEKYLMLKNKVY